MLKLYNNLTRETEPFTPLHAPYCGLYVCGPTVSGESHLGHARPYITFDVLYRYLTYLGLKVRYIRNITDAGHFEEEGREAIDKISTKAVLERLEPMEMVQKYTNKFHWAMHQFNCIDPSVEPTATGHITEQITMINRIIELGYAYVKNGSVYFDVMKYHTDFKEKKMPYGILSGRNPEDQINTTRDLENQDEKNNRLDFALWKAAPKEHIMRWPSPWGEGFPGWHIECSAMSRKYLGEEFDIHGGGMDLLFPHHECEIAQSVVSHQKIPARFWIHNNMITINGRKMGKSYNNVITLSEMFSGSHPILTKAWDPMTIRFFILQSHYRSTLDFSNEALEAAEKGLKRLTEGYTILLNFKPDLFPVQGENKELEQQLEKWMHSFSESMDEDLNTARVISFMFEIISPFFAIYNKQLSDQAVSRNKLTEIQATFKIYMNDILGLNINQPESAGNLDKVMDILIEIRNDAKKRKDFQLSDSIRDRLNNAGIVLKDGKEGTDWSNR